MQGFGNQSSESYYRSAADAEVQCDKQGYPDSCHQKICNSRQCDETKPEGNTPPLFSPPQYSSEWCSGKYGKKKEKRPMLDQIEPTVATSGSGQYKGRDAGVPDLTGEFTFHIHPARGRTSAEVSLHYFTLAHVEGGQQGQPAFVIFAPLCQKMNTYCPFTGLGVQPGILLSGKRSMELLSFSDHKFINLMGTSLKMQICLIFGSK
ncbi:hypothetical protein C8J56DRAFT_879740 [Mycena floridula]|nr:hypothetical protein C8J56DRAFT_879740 [Mycena floridula]